MQNIVLEEPYEFVPPVESDWWCWLVRFYLRGYLRKVFKISAYDIRGVDRLKGSLAAGKSVILAPNHSRLSDPMVLGFLSAEAGCELLAMASWHLFKESAWQRFVIRRMGAFSVYREGNDRASVNMAIEILEAGRRPLVIFPEGAVSRHNDLMMELMDGPAFIARQAAKRREKAGLPGVVIHPVAIRYRFDGDAEAAVLPDIEAFEHKLCWQPQRHLGLVDRIGRIGEGLIALKEVEYLGAARTGDPHQRAERLIEDVLGRLESKWKPPGAGKANSIVARVKNLRTVILPDLIEKKVTPQERDARWRDLAACYYVQQMAHYPRGYITSQDALPERIVETVERLDEDFSDNINYHGPMHCTMMVGEAIEVGTHRVRDEAGDPAMVETHQQLQQMLDQLVAERRQGLAATGPGVGSRRPALAREGAGA